MKKSELLRDILATYQKHGWELKSVLLQSETLGEISDGPDAIVEQVEIRSAPIDALWFSRSSHGGAEAWELRLVAETSYALFQRIAADETEEKRIEIFRDMEDRLCQYVIGR